MSVTSHSRRLLLRIPHEIPGISLSERICLSWRPRRAAAGEGELVPFVGGGSCVMVLFVVVDCGYGGLGGCGVVEMIASQDVEGRIMRDGDYNLEMTPASYIS